MVFRPTIFCQPPDIRQSVFINLALTYGMILDHFQLDADDEEEEVADGDE